MWFETRMLSMFLTILKKCNTYTELKVYVSENTIQMFDKLLAKNQLDCCIVFVNKT